jgi:hypothetical protein
LKILPGKKADKSAAIDFGKTSFKIKIRLRNIIKAKIIKLNFLKL